MKKFQSLTGSIHTFNWGCVCYSNSVVSIPHRFDSHNENKKIYVDDLVRFNPSQVRFTHTCIFWICQKPFKVSIPHRFDSHKKRLQEGQVLQHRFNPSQVRFTRIYITSIEELMKMFQSLTGSIHTKIWFVLITMWLNVSIPHRFDSHFF